MDQPPRDTLPFTADTLIVEAEQHVDWKTLKTYYRNKGIKCYLCPAAEIETFAQGAKIHKFDLEHNLAELNRLAREAPLMDPPPGMWSAFGRWLSDKLKDRGAPQPPLK